MNLYVRFQKLTYWNKLAAIGSICSILGFVLYLFPLGNDNNDAARTVNLNGGENTSIVHQGTGDIVYSPSPDIPQVNIDIPGKWDSNKAWAIVSKYLEKSASLFTDLNVEKIVHRKVGEYNLIFFNNSRSIVLVNETIGDTCHACAAKLSIFEFEKLSGGWKLKEKDIAAFEWGSWGTMEAAKVEVQVIGPNLYGIFFDVGWTMGSSEGVATAIYAKVADEYRNIFHHQTEGGFTESIENSSGDFTFEKTTEWKATIKSENCMTGFCDILVHAKGVVDRRRLDEVTQFYFNGNKYVSEDLPDYLEL